MNTELEVIVSVQRQVEEILEVKGHVIKKYLIAKLFNYILTTPEAINIVNTYPEFKSIILEKAIEFEKFCSNESECYDTYDNENRNILIACSKIIQTFSDNINK
jgi:hypothetical protein